MTAVFMRVDRPDAIAQSLGGYKDSVRMDQNWLLAILSFRGNAWGAHGVFGFNASFEGAFPEYTNLDFLSTDGQNGIKIAYTWAGGSLASYSITYKVEDPDAYSPLGEVIGSTASKDYVTNAPYFDYTRPYPIHTISSDTNGDAIADDFCCRESGLALLAAALYKGPHLDRYTGFPGVAMTSAIDAEGNVSEIKLNFAGANNNAAKYEFTYYDFDLYGDGDGYRLESVTISITRKDGTEPWYVMDRMVYRRRGNGTVSTVSHPINIVGIPT